MPDNLFYAGYSTKDAGMQVKALDDAGRFEGLAATFGNVDLHGDRIVAGAFKQTLRLKGPGFPILAQHDTHNPIGMGLEANEDGRGLHVVGQLLVDDVARAKEVFSLMKAGVIKSLSIGFRTIKAREVVEGGDRVRELQEIDLMEFSPVVFPANPKAKITRVKAFAETLLQQIENIPEEKAAEAIRQMETIIQTALIDGPHQHPHDQAAKANGESPEFAALSERIKIIQQTLGA